MVSNFSWVIKNQLAGCDLPQTNEDFQTLYDKGIRAIVSLTGRAPSSPLIEKLFVDHIHIPIIDWGIPTNEKTIFRFIHFIEKLLPSNPVVVHCFAGIGRTGLMLAVYFIWFEDMSGEEAIDYVRNLRYPSIETAEQESFLIDLADTIDKWKKSYAHYLKELPNHK